jgi:hypothetical protein
MTDLEKVRLAAKRNGEAIRNSLWIHADIREFVANTFDAFAAEITKIIKTNEGEP